MEEKDLSSIFNTVINRSLALINKSNLFESEVSDFNSFIYLKVDTDGISVEIQFESDIEYVFLSFKDILMPIQEFNKKYNI